MQYRNATSNDMYLALACALLGSIITTALAVPLILFIVYIAKGEDYQDALIVTVVFWSSAILIVVIIVMVRWCCPRTPYNCT